MKLRSGRRKFMGCRRSVRLSQLDVSKHLSLYLEPCPVRVKAPDLSQMLSVFLQDHNLVPVTINNKPCVMYVDSGVTHGMMHYSMARSLMLMDKVVKTRQANIETWTGIESITAYDLQNILVEFNPSCSLYCHITVIPDRVKKDFVEPFLGAHELNQNKILQSFTTKKSALHFPRPDLMRMKRNYGFEKPVEYYLKGHRSVYARDKRPVFILVDTGCSDFNLSQEFIAERLRHKRPQSVRLHMVGNDWVEHRVNSLGVAPIGHVFLGKNVLANYQGLLDYGQGFLYFTVGNHTYQTKLFFQE